MSRWSYPELAGEVVARGVAETISASTVRRWLAREAIKPWQYRSWLFPVILTSPPRLSVFLTCMNAAGTGGSWGRGSM